METLDWKFIISSLIPIMSALLGWVVVHWLTSQRDMRNKRRELVLNRVSDAYNTFARDVLRGDTSGDNIKQWVDRIDTLGLSIQLLGHKSK